MEFGKDFIGRRSGIQYGFQTKAGDINLGAWRQIRSQIEEVLWNDIAHPGFDAGLQRHAVLVTTGRLVGGAAADAQQYATTLAARRPGGSFEVWDRQSLLALIELSPEISLNGWSEQPLLELLGLLADASRRRLSSRSIERATRTWVGDDLNRAALATALVGNRLLETQRPDLAMSAAFGLIRAAAVALDDGDGPSAETTLLAGRRLVDAYASVLIEALTPAAGDAKELFNVGDEVIGGVTYPVRCLLMVESLGLLGLLRLDEGDVEGANRLSAALEAFVAQQPGASHPISDRWAASLVPGALLLYRAGSDTLEPWLERVVGWVCDHYERAPGLAGVYADAADEVLYLLGEPFEHVDVPRRRMSYLATVVLDLASVLGLEQLYADALNDFASVDIAFPVIEPLDAPGQFMFDGTGLTSEANVSYEEDPNFGEWRSAVHHRRAPESFGLQRAHRTWELLAIALVLRDRQFLPALRELAGLDA